MSPTRDANVVKLAVENRATESRLHPYLGKFTLQQPLAAFITELCTQWKIDKPPECFALQYTEPPCHYVTEKNRGRIKDGTVLHLIPSPTREAEDILVCLKSQPLEQKKEVLERLVKRSTDITFAHEFIAKQGISVLIAYVEHPRNENAVLPSMLMSFLELMDHGIMPWDDLEPAFINKVISFISSQPHDSRTLSTALAILENIVFNSPKHFALVEKQITIPSLFHHLSHSKVGDIQQAVVALINALFQKFDPQKRKSWAATLSNRQYRTMLINNVLIPAESSIDPDMAHQLYVLQQLLLNQYEERMNTSMDPSDQDATGKIKELRRIAFESDAECSKEVSSRRPEYKKEYKKLGFRNDINPAQDFLDTPPGMLALDNMIFFATNHSDKYAKLVLENCYRADSHECPFGRASIELTKLLCEILQIGEAPTEQGQTFHPMFFSSDHAFEEFFSICIDLLNKTWKEMKATTEDFSKVVSVVKEQITRTMGPPSPSSLDNFRSKINQLTYHEIARIWQRERSDIEEQEMQAPPIKELRKQLEPEILELIQQHRLRFLVEGTRFKYVRGARAKDKFRYCRLSPNHKFLHYDDCDDKAVPTIEELSKKISIVDLKSIVTGKDCPHMKDKTVKKCAQLAFSLLLESNNVNETNSVDFVAPDEAVYNCWVDGINALLRQRMPSTAAVKDLDTLLNMEIKLRLLDCEGVTIPQQEPVIPPPPPNYNFCYQLT